MAVMASDLEFRVLGGIGLERRGQVVPIGGPKPRLALALHAGINCFARTKHGWKTRMFAPGDGIDEDPATGSAAGPLAVHLARYGWLDWGEETEIHQEVEIGRPSLLGAKVVGSTDAIEDVLVGGRVDVLGKGEMSW
jgi:PhzF family phenazine biosynthesis protein